MPRCPNRASERVVKNGHLPTGTRNHRCRACGRQFVESPAHPPVSEHTKALIDRLPGELLSLAGIARVVGAGVVDHSGPCRRWA